MRDMVLCRNTYNKIRQKVSTYVFSPRTKKTLMHLMALLTPFNIVVT
ncbi:IS1 family transposase [Xenorhabdus thuongxuanensis]